MSPTARSLAECRKRGWTAQVVERWNPHAHIRQDLFGVIDIVVLTESAILGVQATSGSNHAARINKSVEEPRLLRWLGAGGRFEVWSWAKRGQPSRWSLRRTQVTL